MKYLIYLLSTLVLLSCNKTEGEGGFATIKGTIVTYDLNSAGELTATYPATDEDVYIIYGTEDNTYNDKTTTSYDGSYIFTNLNKGTYTLYVYSQCDTCLSGQNAITKEILITDKKEVFDTGEIIRYD
ncbi:hypothetical protein DNU06_13305 [Putridiphycobacter roseus]|uniref:Carboxypeptidase regulatory-like domain-containing protein n=1 Tax=Putridiphycobacter roseus TaxID=2219161 RepID=A0A2W1NAF8_9FLAO|nr:hypothetical protein [Putridiphycobacter roseus]PZE16285.1 hypothetical protein DNU06_13305 [Putridiphycobacter roseus]